MASQIPLGAVLLDGDGMLHVVEPDEHVVRAVAGVWVCVRPAHVGQECHLGLAA